MTIRVKLDIENHYELFGVIRTSVDTEVNPPPVLPPSDNWTPEQKDAWDAWSYEQIHVHTGTGRAEGDATYFVKIVESSEPALVGCELDFGL